MAVTVLTSAAASSLVFTLTNESDIILTNYSRNVTPVKTEVRDAENEVVAVAYSGITASISLSGYINGSVATAVAATLSLNNDTSSGGLTGGTILVDSVNLTHAQGEFRRIEIAATQYGSTMTV